jgi:hypothetical protein
MPQISTHEFERLPLRVHDFLAGVPLHDVWAIDLPRTRSGITLDAINPTSKEVEASSQVAVNVRYDGDAHGSLRQKHIPFRLAGRSLESNRAGSSS